MHRMLKVLTLPLTRGDGRPSVARGAGVESFAAPAAATDDVDARAVSPSTDDGETSTGSADGPEGSRTRERRLLDAWREAHWALRLRLRDLMGLGGASEVERLYDLARRADNQLNDFYRARADELTRRLRDLLVDGAASQPTYDDRPHSRLAPPPEESREAAQRLAADLTLSERALLARFRAMGPEDRAAVLRVAQRLADAPAAPGW